MRSLTQLVLFHLLLQITSKGECEFGIFVGTFIQGFFDLELFLFGVEELRDIEGDLAGLFVAFFRKDENGKFGLFMSKVLFSRRISYYFRRNSCCTTIPRVR